MEGITGGDVSIVVIFHNTKPSLNSLSITQHYGQTNTVYVESRNVGQEDGK